MSETFFRPHARVSRPAPRARARGAGGPRPGRAAHRARAGRRAGWGLGESGRVPLINGVLPLKQHTSPPTTTHPHMPVGAWSEGSFCPNCASPIPVSRVRVHAYLVPPHLRARGLGAVFAPDDLGPVRALKGALALRFRSCSGPRRPALGLLRRHRSSSSWRRRRRGRPDRHRPPVRQLSAGHAMRGARSEGSHVCGNARRASGVRLQGRHSPTPPMMGPIELKSELESPPYLYGAEE